MQGKVLEENEQCSPVSTWRIRKWNSRIAGTEKVLVVWVDSQTTFNADFKPKPNQNKTLTILNSKNAERGEDASTGWFVRFKERTHLHNRKVQGEAATADVEALAS